MRKILIAALAALTALAVVSSAAPSPRRRAPTLTFSVSPSKAGTKKKPKPAKVSLKLVNKDSTQTADGIEIDDGEARSSSRRRASRSARPRRLEAEGKTACPSGSLVGNGTRRGHRGRQHRPTRRRLTFNITAFVIGDNQHRLLPRAAGRRDPRARRRAASRRSRATATARCWTSTIPQLAREFPTGTFNGLQEHPAPTSARRPARTPCSSATGCTNTRELPFRLDAPLHEQPDPAEGGGRSPRRTARPARSSSRAHALKSFDGPALPAGPSSFRPPRLARPCWSSPTASSAAPTSRSPQALFGAAAAVVLVVSFARAGRRLVAPAARARARAAAVPDPARGRGRPRRARRRGLRGHRLRRAGRHRLRSRTTSRRPRSTSASGSACRSCRC